MNESALYINKAGDVQLDVPMTDETVWLSSAQLVNLFGRDKSVISRHINNIFKDNELEKASTVANFATVQQEGNRRVSRYTEYFNLDVIISVGYRVKSKEGIRFRQWASRILKEHLIKGYSVNQQRLTTHGFVELQQTLILLNRTLSQHDLISDLGNDILSVIIHYSKTWQILLAYDEENLTIPTASTHLPLQPLNYEIMQQAIHKLKQELLAKNQATPLFGQERENNLSGILGNLEQTFDGQVLYPSVEERAAHLLYFVIKDHPFIDGNKRIGCFLFLLYCRLQKLILRLNDNALVALALLVAESAPSQKSLMVRLVMSLLIDDYSIPQKLLLKGEV